MLLRFYNIDPCNCMYHRSLNHEYMYYVMQFIIISLVHSNIVAYRYVLANAIIQK